MKGLLVRVGIDSSDEGRWNAPVDTASWSFAYVPIAETKAVRRGFGRSYDELRPGLQRLGYSLPAHLVGRAMHLDPDFEALTYGDQGRRAGQIGELETDDILVFYAGLRNSTKQHARLIYALIGLYVIQEIVPAMAVGKELWMENAHTRRIPGPTDIVVRAKPTLSGRFACCVPIGEYRDLAYRARRDVLKEWGGLSVKDGYLQRSARLPAFADTEKFCRWFRKLNVPVLRSNNL
jgi:hypothetical protein